jgi:hypothetical protein
VGVGVSASKGKDKDEGVGVGTGEDTGEAGGSDKGGRLGQEPGVGKGSGSGTTPGEDGWWGECSGHEPTKDGVHGERVHWGKHSGQGISRPFAGIIGGDDPGLDVSAVDKGGDVKLNTSNWELA